MARTLHAHDVCSRWEETECQYCGYPLLLGDVAYYADDGIVYCSAKCYNADKAHEERIHTA